MARFRISESFALPDRNLFVLAGDVVAGPIARGMQVEIRVNSCLATKLDIHAVEYIRHSSRPDEVALCIKCENHDELDLLKALNIGSEVVEVE
jgi:hypothetical protein